MSKEIVLCQYHEEETPSCIVDRDKRTFYCLGCDAEGHIDADGALVRTGTARIWCGGRGFDEGEEKKP